ncbi:hypothetical protein NEOKW01_0902 [Nematocida sp. AWRm80]|nr:hypothetical protein NEOKW01_0902 [Nematocida sp. AWRm80]
MTQKENGAMEYSIDLQRNEPYEIGQTCVSCGENGSLKVLLLEDLYFPDSVITSFVCSNCGYKDKQIDQMDSTSSGVEIVCQLKKKEDLHRYIIISSGTKITLESGEQGVSLVQKEDAVIVVESLIRFILESLTSQSTLPEDPITEQEMEGLKEYKQIALFLQQSLDNLDLTLILKDDKGITRILPENTKPDEHFKTLPFEYFLNTTTQMTSYTPERQDDQAVDLQDLIEQPEQ